jgi:predicted ArsR family transcriptional regulator
MPSTIKTRTIPGNPLADLVRQRMEEAIDPTGGWQTVHDLAPQLGISINSTRAHLDRLVADGLAERRRARVAGVAGSPRMFYRPL